MIGACRVWVAGLLIWGGTLGAGCGAEKSEEQAPVSISVRLQGEPGGGCAGGWAWWRSPAARRWPPRSTR